MLSRAIRSYANDLDFVVVNSMAYGDLNGYTVTFKDSKDTHAMFFDVTFLSMESYNDVMEQLQSKEMTDSYQIINHTLDAHTLGVYLEGGRDLGERFEELSQLLTHLFHQAGALGNEVCAICKEPFGSEESVYYNMDGIAHQMHASCANTLSETQPAAEALQPEEEEYEEQAAPAKRNKAEKSRSKTDDESKHYALGFLGALLGAIAGAIPWAIVTWFGFFVGWIGIIIALLSRFGFERFGGKRGAGKFIIIVLTSLLGILLGEFSSEAAYMYYQIKQGIVSISILEWFQYMFTQKDYLFSLAINLGSGIGLALLTSLLVFIKGKKEKNA